MKLFCRNGVSLEESPCQAPLPGQAIPQGLSLPHLPESTAAEAQGQPLEIKEFHNNRLHFTEVGKGPFRRCTYEQK